MHHPMTPPYPRWCGWFAVIGSACVLVKSVLGDSVETAGHFLLFTYYFGQAISARLYTNTTSSDAPAGDKDNQDGKAE